MKCIEKAYAKLNLTLDILGKRPDGYHEMEMIMQTVAFCDQLILTTTNSRRIQLSVNLPYLPQDGRNLAVAAASAFYQASRLPLRCLYIELEKRIPISAGLGGGSADAAAVLRGLNRMHGAPLRGTELHKLAATIGSDVAFCIDGGTQWARGRGELLTPLPPLPDCYVVLCKPPISVSTKQAFSLWRADAAVSRPDTAAVIARLEAGDLPGVAAGMANVLEQTGPPVLVSIQRTLRMYGALGAVMSGSGPTCFGLFDNLTAASAAYTALRRIYQEVYSTSVCGHLGIEGR